MVYTSRWVYPDKSVTLGRYWRNGPLVFSLVPRCHGLYGSAKEHPDRESLRQALVLSHLFAPIIGQRLAQRGGHVPKLLREPVAGTPRIRPVHPCQEH